jgi:hypothetical protein
MKKSIQTFAAFAVGASMLAMPLMSLAAAPLWNVSGSHVITFNLGSDYAHDVTFVQDNAGNLTGSGGFPAGGPHTYMWDITGGSVSGNTLTFTALYSATPDAAGTVMHATGTIASNGSVSGTWDDNYAGGNRTGTFTMPAGSATAVTSSLAAEDFGVVNYDTGLGMLKGYTAGFGLTNADLGDIQSVTVQLYSGATLLETNTGTAKINTLSGSQFSSPFDVSGTFDYATDGYWTNVKNGTSYQTMAADRVVATVTLTDGTVLTATNTNLTGDPTTIFPVVTPPTTGDKDACKNGGWKTMTSPSFKNQGQCVSYMNHH